MYRLRAFSAALVTALLLFAPAVQADDWTTVGGDAQRSSWVRADIKISTASVAGPDFQLLWRMELDNEARGNNALTTPVLLDFLISHWGFRSLAFVGASSGGVFVIDTDLARPEWERRVIAGSGPSSPACPGGITANLTRPTEAAMPSIFGISARGRRSPARSGVGEPREGAVQLGALPPPTSSPGPTSDARVRAPARASLSGVKLVYALAGDGRLHALYVSNGRDRGAPKQFLPPNANASGLIVVDDVAYVATRNGCGDADDGVWSLDLGTADVTSWKSHDGPVVGAAGVAIGPDGVVYAATQDGPLVALMPKALEQQAATAAIGFRSSPVVLDYRGDDHVAALDSKGAIQLYAAGDLSKPLASSPAGSLPAGADTALAAWRDAAGATWILAPTADSIVAWELVENGPARRLQKGWESPKMTAPLPPIVVNGVVFALDGGNASKPAKLHALDGGTGKPIWDSGSKITSHARGHTLSSGPGHVYLTTHDSAVYAFGFPMEH